MARKEEKISCIYIITNKVNEKYYVGRAISWKDRKSHHISNLKKGTHANGHLQNAWNLYGEDNFEFDILEEYEPEFLPSMENWWCNLLNSHNDQFGYNIEPTSPNGKIKTSEETKKKMSIAKTGKPNPGGAKWIEENRRYKIIQYSLDGSFIKIWSSIRGASLTLGIDGELIRKSLKRKSKSTGKFRWIKYVEDYPLQLLEKYKKYNEKFSLDRQVKMYQYTLEGELVKIWNSVKEINTSQNFKKEAIRYKIKNSNSVYKNYLWSSKELSIQEAIEKINSKKPNKLKEMKKNPESVRKRALGLMKPILQLDLNRNTIRKWESITSSYYEGYHSSDIIKAIKAKKLYKGYFWDYFIKD